MENKVDIKVDLLITRDAKGRVRETNTKTSQKYVQFMGKNLNE